MNDTLVTAEILEPYAQALMSLAKAHDLVDRFGDDVNAVLTTLGESDDLRQLIGSPLIKPEVKKGVLQQVFGGQVHEYMGNFLNLLVDRGRIAFIEGICQKYRVLLRQLKQTVLAEITSASPLSDEQQSAITQRVKQITGAQQVEIQSAIDPGLIGGVVIKVGSQVIDASLRGQLRRISINLLSSANN